MKKLLSMFMALAVMAFVANPALAKEKCTTIQSGELYSSTGETLTTGFDKYGYNYQGHMFSGRYCDSDRKIGGDYCDVNLIMKWNDGWLSNQDCSVDGLLDRYFGYTSYQGSGAWETNHQSGQYERDDGKICKWNYFVKIVAVPTDATLVGGVWYSADGTEIGPVSWGSFATIQEIYNDPCDGSHGVSYKSPVRAGLGNW